MNFHLLSGLKGRIANFKSLSDSDETLKLWLHSLDGLLVRESSISVKAAYSDLCVFGLKVFIAISSGPTNALEGSMMPGQLRLGSDPNDMDTSSPLFADQIWEWDTPSGAFRCIRILNPLRADDQAQNEPVSHSFSPGGSSQERAIQRMGVGLECNTKPSNIIVHSFDRIAVFNRAFFSEEKPINPRTGHLHYLRLLLTHDVRVLPFSLPGTLPAISNNRVLAYQKVVGKYLFLILDFDQKRVNNLLNKTPEEQEALHAELYQAESNAREKVKVVTRQSYAQEEGIGGSTIDAKYPIRSVPLEWREHLKSLTQQETQEQEGASLIFDEAPERCRSGRLGITNDCVMLTPEPGDSGISAEDCRDK
ncbi:hypothetical protein CPB84DRAFT_1747306 [Gymnopilus junonius]|uniref:Uncharacterized protein n=1 Tax=Gymnopilus junonius TaxID=109634 RepID=A0A9P5NP46_GYMJU|nr:hypothetical protein CPB84DRAFT_1747306 [Gymnopilus junonius]